MKYDFTSIMDRRGMDAMAVDGIGGGGSAPDCPKEGFDVIPMWVADMNFPTVPTVPEAIIRRAQHPAYGYFKPPKAYFDAIIDWHRQRNGVEGLLPEHISYANGVLGGVATALNVLCARGDSVLVQSPTYIGFTSTLQNNGYQIVLSPLIQDKEGIWRMDYVDMEAKIVENRIHAAVICSPHNPSGRVWERWELEKAMELFQKHDVYVVSDEIWSDLILANNKHIPTQSISADAQMRTVSLYAPSKTFNLAGLVGSYRVVYNRRLRDLMDKEAKLTQYNHMNVLSMHALMGAYCDEGAQWVDELCQVLTENVDYSCDFIAKHFKGVKVSKPEGTYMLFLDCTDWCESYGKSIEEVERAAWDVGVAIQDGRPFHGPCHIRMNLALPLSRVQEAFDRLDRYVFNAKV